MRNAKQKKAVPAKNSEAIFWRPRFTKPLRAGKRANANFACSEGSFLSGVSRHMAGWPFLRGQPLLRRLVCQIFLPVRRCLVPGLRAAFLPPLRRLLRLFVWPALPLPAMRFVRAVPSCFGCLFACSVLVARAFFSYLLSFAFSCLALTSQTSFHLSLKPRREFPCLSPPAALFPACGPLISFCPTRAAGTCPPCALCAQFRLVLAVCLPVLRCLHAHFSLIFRLFLFGCCLSNFFSFVAQAATGISLLVPSRGFVPGLRVLSPAAFSRTFVPIACLPAVRFVLVVCSSVCVVCVGFLSCFSSFPA